MTETTESIFMPTIQKTDELIGDLAAKLGWQKNRHRVYSLLRAVLHTLRDRLTLNEAVDLGAQLPMLVRGFYYEGWRPAAAPIKLSKTEFLERVQGELRFPLDRHIEELVQAALEVLGRHITAGELKDIESILPKSIQHLFPLK